MENIRKQYQKELRMLEISEEEELTVKLVTKKFKKKALRVHTDKTHNGDDEEFKELLSDYEKLKDAINEVSNENNEIEEKSDLQNFFEKHNFAKEFSQSWTIFIEKEKVDEWKSVLGSLFPDFKNTQGNGTQFKTPVDDRIVYTTLYDVVTPKMNIQGNHISIRKYVFNILPDIYNKVRNIPNKIQLEGVKRVPVNAKVKLSGETVFSCEVCDKTYVRKAAIKKHMQMKHAPPPPLAQIVTAPIPLGFTMIHTNNTEESDQGNEERVDDLSLEETPHIMEEIGPQQIDSNWQCGVCGQMYESEQTVNDHMTRIHVDLNADVIIEHCAPCGNKDRRISELEVQEAICKAIEKKYEVLERRHEHLKQKFEETIKANKEYSKRLMETIKENTELKTSSEKEAEVLIDTLNLNQVLMEEIKVKDDIIRTNEELKNAEEQDGAVDQDVQVVSVKVKDPLIKCDECDWTSSNANHLPGHMLKHIGQYICDRCNKRHKTKGELTEHIQALLNSILVCITCDKNFESQHSLKQHMSSKHSSERSFPVGHPQRTQLKNHETLNIACTKCDQKFANGRQVDLHMKDHTDGFKTPTSDKICRYFRNGYCAKGEHCIYKHVEIKSEETPRCNRGPDCIFMQQNRCNYFHPNIGVQRPKTNKNPKQCKFQEHCRNKFECNFSHNTQVFRPGMMWSRPP